MPRRQALVVLVGTTHAGNIGGCARAMATMGLDSLALAGCIADAVSDEAVARASGCEDILASAAVHPDLGSALAECNRAYAFTGRRRGLSLPPTDLRAAAAGMAGDLADGAKVALVFGPEKTGLSNADLDRCDCLVAIPTARPGKSLNLAAAVQVACYELFLAGGGSLPPRRRIMPTKAQTAELIDHLERSIGQGCPPSTPGKLRRMIRRLRLLLAAADPEAADVRMLRGLLASIDRLVQKARQ